MEKSDWYIVVPAGLVYAACFVLLWMYPIGSSQLPDWFVAAQLEGAIAMAAALIGNAFKSGTGSRRSGMFFVSIFVLLFSLGLIWFLAVRNEWFS